MKMRRKIFTLVAIIFITITAVSLNSCEFFIESEKAKASMETATNKAIKIQKSEAKILVKASRYSLDIIKLCKIIELEDIAEHVKTTIGEVKNQQLIILQKYDKVAAENIISIPKYSDLEYREVKRAIDADGLGVHLELLNEKISSQKKLVKKLSDKTSNADFKALALHTNLILEKGIDKIEETLETIKTDS